MQSAGSTTTCDTSLRSSDETYTITGADLGILRGGGGVFWAGILQGSRSVGIFIY